MVSRMSIRAGFTIVELLVVIGVILALAGIGYPLAMAVKQRANVQSSRALVQAVTTAIAAYQTQRWTVTWDHDGDDPDHDGVTAGGTRATPPRSVTVPLWDLNQGASPLPTGAGQMDGDGIIDGVPSTAAGDTTDGPFWSELIASGYTGLAAMSNSPIPQRSIARDGRIIDAWKQPLHIEWDAKRFAPTGFGVWSTGKDKIDGTADDLCSWRTGDE